MTSIALLQVGKRSLQNELEMHGVSVMSKAEVRRIKREACDGSMLFWFISCMPRSVYARTAGFLSRTMHWMPVAVFSLSVFALGLILLPSVFGRGFVYVLLLSVAFSVAVVLLLMACLFTAMLAIERSPLFVLWSTTPYLGEQTVDRFDMPGRVVRTAEYVKRNLPDVTIEIVYEQHDPFLRVRRGWECCYIDHWI